MDNAISFNKIKNQTILLLVVAFISAISYWKLILLNLHDNEIKNGFGWPTLLFPIIFFCLYIIKDKFNRYALLIGLSMAISMGGFLGAVSGIFEQAFNGLILQALLITFLSILTTIFLYKQRFINVNNSFVKFVIYFTQAFLSFLALQLLLGKWNMTHRNEWMTVNIFIIILAYLVFMIDLKIIETEIQNGNVTVNKSWLFAIELLVDVLWVYFGIIFLLLKLKDRKDK